MSEEQNADARLKAAVKAVARGLEERGVLRDPAKALAEKHSARIYVASDGATIRIAGAGGVFYSQNPENPVQPLVDELYHVVPEADKMPATAEQLAENRKRLKRTGIY